MKISFEKCPLFCRYTNSHFFYFECMVLLQSNLEKEKYISKLENLIVFYLSDNKEIWLRLGIFDST